MSSRVVWLAFPLLVGGCGVKSARIAVPDIEPAAAAAAVFATSDQNGDDRLSKDELRAHPGLLAAFAAIDASGDGQLEEQELEQRLQTYIDGGIGIMSLSCFVTVNGRPVENATVEFEPEEFLAGALSPARAITGRDGSGPVLLTDGSLPGIAPGIYRVKVSKQSGGKELFPAKYNAETTLGYEVTIDAGGAPARFNLSPR